MPRGGNHHKHRPVRYEFLEVLVYFAKSHKGSIPSHYGWWKLVRQQGYTLAWTSFRAHTAKLEAEGYIAFQNSVVVINHSRWEYMQTLEELNSAQPLLPIFSLTP